MRRFLWRTALILLLTLGTLIGTRSQHASALDEKTIVTTVSEEMGGAVTDGTYVIWTVKREAGGWEVVAARLDDRRPVTLTPGPPATFWAASIDRGIIVWTGQEAPGRPWLVQAHDLTTGRTVTIAAGAVHSGSIAYPLVTWLEVDGNEQQLKPREQRLKARDLRSLAPPITLVRENVATFSLRDDALVWLQVDRGERPGLSPERWWLYTQRLGQGPPVLIDQGLSGGIDGSVYLPSFFTRVGELVVFVVGSATGSLVVIDLRTGERQGFSYFSVGRATTDGRYVFFENGDRGRGHPVDLWVHDLATDAGARVVADLGGYGGLPAAQGGVLVWQRGAFGRPTEIHAAPVGDLLPSARRPAPPEVDAELAYFPETGHSLIFGFKGFWERNGGRPIFGYPLTEEFQQPQQQTQQPVPTSTVQFFERQRFEYHRALAGTPYEVQLGRLGAEEAQRRGLLGTWAFQPLPAAQAPRADCINLPEVQHRLCGEFRPYWEGHGLELGDEGFSFRESLALFGYPISEEFIDPDTGLVTQYFERAVFEWHPDNPVPDRVLLRRLGAERLEQWGW